MEEVVEIWEFVDRPPSGPVVWYRLEKHKTLLIDSNDPNFQERVERYSGQKVLELLMFLLRSGGKPVARADIETLLWRGNTSVGIVNTYISTLRKLLNDDSQRIRRGAVLSGRIIEALSGGSLRFAARITSSTVDATPTIPVAGAIARETPPDAIVGSEQPAGFRAHSADNTAQFDALRDELEKHSRVTGEQADAIALVNTKLDAILDVLARHKIPGTPDRDAFSYAVQQKAVRDIVSATDEVAQEATRLLESGQIDTALALLRSDAIAAGKAAAMRWRRLGDLAFSVNAAEARHAYIQAVTLDPTHIDTFVLLVRLDIATGNLAAAEQHALNGLAASNVPGDRLSVLIKLGDLRVRQKRHEDARRHFEEAYILSRGEIARKPADLETLNDHALVLERMYEAGMSSKDLPAARFFIEECYKLVASLHMRVPHSLAANESLASVLNFYGDLEMEAGNYTRARDHYDRSCRLRSALAQLPDADSKLMRDVSISLDKLANVASVLGDKDEAEGYFLDSIRWREKCTQADPSNNDFWRDAYVGYVSFAELLLDDLPKEEVDSAISKAIEISEKLIAVDPDNPYWREDLIRAYLFACRRGSKRRDEEFLLTVMDRASRTLGQRPDAHDDLNGNSHTKWCDLYLEVIGAHQLRAGRKVCEVGRMLAMKYARPAPTAMHALMAVLVWNEWSAQVELSDDKPIDAIPYLQEAWLAAKKRLELNPAAEDNIAFAINAGLTLSNALFSNSDAVLTNESEWLRAQAVLAELEHWILRLSQAKPDDPEPKVQLAWVLLSQGNIREAYNDDRGAAAYLARALDLVRGLDHPEARRYAAILKKKTA